MNKSKIQTYREEVLKGCNKDFKWHYGLDKNKNPVCLEKLSKQTGGNK